MQSPHTGATLTATTPRIPCDTLLRLGIGTRLPSRLLGPRHVTMPGASSRGVHPPRGGEPLFRFGLVSDVQHADIPDGQSFGGVPRYYRNALVLLRRAVEGFKASDVAFALHLGDVRCGLVLRGRG